MNKIAALLLGVLSILVSQESNAILCGGRFPNPVTDVCWLCVFPIRVGPVPVGSAVQPEPLTDIPPPLICSCPAPPPIFVRFGIGISYWEPARVAETVRSPYCSPFLGGATFGPLTPMVGHSKNVPGATDEGEAFYHVHWFMTPFLQWVGSSFSTICMQSETFDLGYVTELDPLWNNDETSFLLSPEAILFANPVSQIACAADTIAAATTGFGLDQLFWCSGSQGSVYPMSGFVTSPNGGVDGSLLDVHRHVARMHRMLMAMDTSTPLAMCFPTGFPQPILRKNQYKQQMMYPIPNNVIGLGFGVPSVQWSLGREIPYVGEDFNYLIWRKRTCCAL